MNGVKERAFSRGIARRDFIKLCMTATAMMGLPMSMHSRVVQAAQAADKPPVIWLHFQECTGCSESLLRSSHPTVSSLILDLISLDYHETLMAGSGTQAEESLQSLDESQPRQIHPGRRRGDARPPRNGIFCKVGGKTALDSLRHAGRGRCRNPLHRHLFGASAASNRSASNPTGAIGVREIVKDKPIVNIPGYHPTLTTFSPQCCII